MSFLRLVRPVPERKLVNFFLPFRFFSTFSFFFFATPSVTIASNSVYLFRIFKYFELCLLEISKLLFFRLRYVNWIDIFKNRGRRKISRSTFSFFFFFFSIKSRLKIINLENKYFFSKLKLEYSHERNTIYCSVDVRRGRRKRKTQFHLRKYGWPRNLWKHPPFPSYTRASSHTSFETISLC